MHVPWSDLGQAGRVQKLCMCLGRARARLTHAARELSLSELRCGGFRRRREARARLVVCRNYACALVGLGSGCSCAEIMHVPWSSSGQADARRARAELVRAAVRRLSPPPRSSPGWSCAEIMHVPWSDLGQAARVQKLCMCLGRARARLTHAARELSLSELRCGGFRLRREARARLVVCRNSACALLELGSGRACAEIMHVPWWGSGQADARCARAKVV